MIIWNGPMGMFEDPQFADGTNKIAQAITELSAMKVVGGGDTISAIDKIGLMDKFNTSTGLSTSFVSTGGGACSISCGRKTPWPRCITLL